MNGILVPNSALHHALNSSTAPTNAKPCVETQPAENTGPFFVVSIYLSWSQFFSKNLKTQHPVFLTIFYFPWVGLDGGLPWLRWQGRAVAAGIE
jgi:hypothetical protein